MRVTTNRGVNLLYVIVAMNISVAAGQTIGWHTVSTGHYPNANPPTVWSQEKNVVWKTKMPGPSYASPVVLQDRLFVTSQPAELICIRNSDGDVIWKRTHTFREVFGEDKAIQIAKVQAATRESVKALRWQIELLVKESGRLKRTDPSRKREIKELDTRIAKMWEQVKQLPRPRYATIPRYIRDWDAGNAACTPVTDGKNVYAVFATGIVSSHTIDGERRWMRFLETPTLKFGHAASPVLVGDKLIVHLVDLVALDAQTGEEVWRVKHKPLHCTPTAIRIGEVDVLLAAGGTMVRVSDGKILAARLYGEGVASPIVHDGNVYVQQRGKIKAMRFPSAAGDEAEVQMLWGGEGTGSGFNQIPTPVYHAGLLYGVSSAGILDVTNADTGERVYRKRLSIGAQEGSYNYYPSPTLAGDFIYVGANNGNTLVLSPGEEYKEVAVNFLEPYTSTPVFVDKRMYIRGEEHLYCIGE